MPSKYKELIEAPTTITTVVPKVTTQAINTKHVLTTNVSSIYEEVATAEQMDAYLTDSANIGKMYKYIGTTGTKYFYSSLYICTPKTAYSITPTLSNIIGDASNPTTIEETSSATLSFSAAEHYSLPDDITVTGATYTWNKTTGMLTLSNPTANVSIAITGDPDVYTITTTLSHVVGDTENPTSIAYGTTASLVFSGMTGYVLPTSISISGSPTYTWNRTTGTLTLSNVSENTTISIVGNELLCFTANTAGSTIAMSKSGTPAGSDFCSSTDGINWTTFTPGTTTITLTNIGDKVYFKGNNPNGIGKSRGEYCKFSLTGSIAASGNIMGLIDDGICESITIPSTACFNSLFNGCTALTTSPKLPATTLTDICYRYMFYGCTNLTSMPELPATTVTNYCYEGMFYDCSSLSSTYSLPATTLAFECYVDMFAGCTSLTTPPSISATSLAEECMAEMFQNCTSLTTAPTLSATTLATWCYAQMFKGCTSLTTMPALPATTLADYCYENMFSGCTSLTTVRSLSASHLVTNCYANMFEGCTALTTAPKILATSMEDSSCCSEMFKDCTSLTTISTLKIRTLYQGFDYMFSGCTALYIYDSLESGIAECEWKIPSSGTALEDTYIYGIFTNCLGTRESDDIEIRSGSQLTFYTQNEPV